MKKKLLSLVLALVMVVSLFAGVPATVGATEAVEAPAKLEELTATTTKTLEDGMTYYITGDLTVNANKSYQNGLVVADNATATLHIPAGMTLAVYGKNGSGTSGGGAAILLRNGATLIVVGGGTLEVYGGNAANGSNGGRGGNSAAQDNKLEDDEANNWDGTNYYYAGRGGAGGNGGGGGGAGIGTNGGNGGSGSGAGGAYWGWTEDQVEDDDGPQHGTRNGNGGAGGASGSSAGAMGTLYVSSEVKIAGRGGLTGSNTASGGSRGSSHYEFDDSHERGVAGSAGGGAGGAGWGGALVGSGGGGGGQGGGGGNSGYLCRYFYIGGGGGAGGWGANNSHGNDGGHGDYGKFGSESYANDEKNAYCNSPYFAGSGNNRYGKGAYGWKHSSQYATGGSGGQGGSSGGAATVYTLNDDGGKYKLLVDWAGDNANGEFGFTEGEQTLSFDLNTLYWNDAVTGGSGENEFYYILCDENGNPIKDSAGNEIRGKVTFDEDGKASLVLPEGLPAGKYTMNVGCTASEQGELPVGGFEIAAKPLDESNVEVDLPDIAVNPPVFNGEEIKPGVNLSYEGKDLVENEDYIVSYSDNKDAGVATMTVRFIGNYSGTIEKTFTIEKCDPEITVEAGRSAVYDRAPVEAGTDSGDVLYTYDGDGEIAVTWYVDENGAKGTALSSAPADAGAYWIGVSAAESSNSNAAAEVAVQFVITPYELKDSDVAIDPDAFVYNTDELGPAVTVKHGEVTLVETAEYTLSGHTGTYVNTYTVTVVGVDNYSGTVEKTWNIEKATPELTANPGAAAITYGQTLADSALTGGTVVLNGVPVSGTFAWETPSIAPVVADSGATAYTVVFTPEDSDNYHSITCSVMLTVNKAPQPSPDGINKTDESIMEKNDGAIAGLSESMEYRYEGGAWTDVGGTSLENLPAGVYEIRYKEDANHFAGEIVEVTVAEGRYLTVSFDSEGGNEIAASEDVTYNSAISAPEEPVKRGYYFAGWFEDEACKSAWNFELNTVASDLTLYAKWSMTRVYSVSGTVETGGAPVEGATVQVMRGNEVVAATVTTADGSYVLDNLPRGDYNIVITSGDKVITKLITVEKENVGDAVVDLPLGAVSSNVEIVDTACAAHALTDTVGTLVDGLDVIASEQTPADGEHITIRMVVTPKTDVTTEEFHEDKEAQVALKKKAYTRLLEFFDLDLMKIVTNNGATETSLDIGGSNSELLKIVIPFDAANAMSVVVYRYHDGEAEAMEQNPAADEEGYVVDRNSVTIYAKHFSAYAIGYIPPFYAPEYSITSPRAENGKITLSSDNASKGDTVTVSVSPDEGYQLSKLIVTDENGKEIEVTPQVDGTFAFKMPGGKVTIVAKFVRMSVYSNCPKDETCPVYGFVDADVTAWYHDGVHYCIDKGMMSGYGNGIFDPDADTTRAMITVMLWRLSGSPVVNARLDFADVAEGQWYTEAIRWAKSEGIVDGYGNGFFGTNDPVTREQMVAVLWRYAQNKGIDVSVGEETNILSYGDAFDVAEYAIPAMQWACGSGMVQGMSDPDGNGLILAPESKGTRAQIATMMMRFCENVVK